MDELCCEQQSEGYGVHIDERSSYKERKGNALASGAEEGRDELRKATGSRKWALYPWISEWSNPARVMSSHHILNK